MQEKRSSRRSILQGLGSLSALGLLRCVSTASDASGSSSSSGEDSDGSTSSSNGGNDASTASDATLNPDATLNASALAVGSGAFLDGKEYGNPFSGGASATCEVFKQATKGPCHSNTYNRKDVSNGLVGLPTRYELLITDASCNPIADAIVEIWYASPAGTYSKAAQAIDDANGYSGSLSDLNVGFCTGNNSEAVASNWLRGWQKTDANGRVTIDGIFPGWYSGRTPHIHFIVTASSHTTSTSQLVFDETLTTQVYTKHGSYSARGDKDTKNATDNVLSQGLPVAMALMEFSQQDDGALVCWKQITVS